MTTARRFSDDEGEFQPWHPSARPCLVCCRDDGHRYRIWESHDGAYEDEQHECQCCGSTWWVDGADA